MGGELVCGDLWEDNRGRFFLVHAVKGDEVFGVQYDDANSFGMRVRLPSANVQQWIVDNEAKKVSAGEPMGVPRDGGLTD